MRGACTLASVAGLSPLVGDSLSGEVPILIWSYQALRLDVQTVAKVSAGFRISLRHDVLIEVSI